MLSKWLMGSPSGHSKNSCPSKSFAHSISAAQEETRRRARTRRDIFQELRWRLRCLLWDPS